MTTRSPPWSDSEKHSLKSCRFSFGSEPSFDGFAHGTTWNGFDNVSVTAAVHQEISAHFRKEYETSGYAGGELTEVMQSFDIDPDASGLYSYAYGFATSIDDPDDDAPWFGVDRFSLEGETISTISDAAWKTIGDQLRHEFPSAEYGDLSPAVTLAFDRALHAVVIEWIKSNVPTDARCDNCHCSAAVGDIGTTCGNCERGCIR